MTPAFKWYCDRLGTKSISYPCTAEQVSRTFNCKGCPGAVQIQQKEEAIRVSSLCNYKGCEKTQVLKGFCTEHVKAEGLYEKFQAHKALKKANEKFVEKQKEEIKAADPVPAVSQHENHTVNLVEMYKAWQQADLEKFITNLNSYSDPYSRLQYAFREMERRAYSE